MQPAKWPKVLPPMTPEQEGDYYAVELRENMAFGLVPPGSEQCP
jgi:hypothetical protein